METIRVPEGNHYYSYSSFLQSKKMEEIHDRIIVHLPQYSSFDIMCVLQDMDEEDLNLADSEIIELVCDILDNDGPR
jgi:hypothetical protein